MTDKLLETYGNSMTTNIFKNLKFSKGPSVSLTHPLSPSLSLSENVGYVCSSMLKPHTNKLYWHETHWQTVQDTTTKTFHNSRFETWHSWLETGSKQQFTLFATNVSSHPANPPPSNMVICTLYRCHTVDGTCHSTRQSQNILLI